MTYNKDPIIGGVNDAPFPAFLHHRRHIVQPKRKN